MTSVTIDAGGSVALPEEVRRRYGLAPNIPLRLIQTRNGILLVPLTDEPMSTKLAAELEQWQALGASAWEAFPYEDAAE